MLSKIASVKDGICISPAIMYLKSKILALVSNEKVSECARDCKDMLRPQKIVPKVNSSFVVLMFASCRSVVLHAKTKDETTSTSDLKLVSHDTSVSRCLPVIRSGRCLLITASRSTCGDEMVGVT
jgi:hypothetical protein